MISFLSPAYLTYPTLVPSLLAQTCRDWELVIGHDGECDEWEGWTQRYADPRIRFRQTMERLGEFGHPIREAFLSDEVLRGRYIVMTNHDNYFIPLAVSTLEQQTADVIAWPVLHNYFRYSVLHPRLSVGHIDLSSVAIRTDLARAIGFPWRDHDDDFSYIQEAAKMTSNWKFIEETLCVHN